MMRRYAWLGLTLVVGACGGDGGDGGGGSGVDAGKLLVAIDDAEAVALCKYERKLQLEALGNERAYCTYSSQDFDAASCGRDVEKCIEDGEYDDELAYDGECSTLKAAEYISDIEEDCEATLGQLEDCIESEARIHKAAVAAAVCDGTFSDAEEAEENEEDYPGCEAITACFTSE